MLFVLSFRIPLEDSAQTQIQALHAALRRLDPEMLAELYPYFATLLQLPLTDQEAERVQFLSSEALQDQIFRSVRQYVEAFARREPLILFWEDLHWGDPSSLLLLETVSADQSSAFAAGSGVST